MTPKETLQGLIERVEAGSGSDRQLDADICVAVMPETYRWGETWDGMPLVERYYVFDDSAGWSTPGGGQDPLMGVPELTGSVDAAIALQEKLSPFCIFTVRRLEYDAISGETSLCESIVRAGWLHSEIARAGSYSRALLSATLRAHLATMEGE